MSNEDETSEEMRAWQEHFGDMIPERIVDTKVDENGKRYYKVQWANTVVEHGRNFLEAEQFIQKYWNRSTKQLEIPGKVKKTSSECDEAGSSKQKSDDDSTTESDVQKKVKTNTTEEEKANSETDDSLNHEKSCEQSSEIKSRKRHADKQDNSTEVDKPDEIAKKVKLINESKNDKKNDKDSVT